MHTNILSFFLSWLYFLEQFRFTAKLSWKYTVPIFPTPTYAQPSPLSAPLTRVVHLLKVMNLHLYCLKSIVCNSVYSWFVHWMGFHKCIITYVHRYGIQSIFTTLKILCVLPVHPFPCLQPIANTDLFTVSIILPFPECHIVGITSMQSF